MNEHSNQPDRQTSRASSLSRAQLTSHLGFKGNQIVIIACLVLTICISLVGILYFLFIAPPPGPTPVVAHLERAPAPSTRQLIRTYKPPPKLRPAPIERKQASRSTIPRSTVSRSTAPQFTSRSNPPSTEQEQPKSTSESVLLVRDLMTTGTKTTEYEIDTLEVRNKLFVNEPYEWLDIPKNLVGATVIRPPDTKDREDHSMSVTLDCHAVVYVCYHPDAIIPSWLQSWQIAQHKSGQDLSYRSQNGKVEVQTRWKPFAQGRLNIGQFDSTVPHAIFVTKVIRKKNRISSPKRAYRKAARKKLMAQEKLLQENPLISDLSINCGEAEKYEIGTLAVGTKVYVDERQRWSEILVAFQGATVIRPLAAHGQHDNAMSFTLNRHAVVCIAYHVKSEIPDWLQTWEATGKGLTYRGWKEDQFFEVRVKDFPAGKVSIGRVVSEHTHTVFVLEKSEPLPEVSPINETPPEKLSPARRPLIGNLLVSCGGADKYKIDTLEEGKTAYVDRDYKWVKVPKEFRGMTLVRPRNDHKQSENQLTFTLPRPAAVYLAHRPQEQMPSWAKSWEDTGKTITLRHKKAIRLFKVRRKTFHAGKVEIGKMEANYLHVIFAAALPPGETPSIVQAASETEKKPPRKTPPEDPSPDTGPPQTDPLITKLFVHSGETDQYEIDTLEIGKRVYVEQEFTWKEISEEFRGLTVVRPVETDRPRDNHMTFILTKPAMVYLAHHAEMPVPGWLRKWKGLSNKRISYDHTEETRAFMIRCKVFPAGKVDIPGLSAKNTHIIFIDPE